jgi:outer membrane protein OmpA-like peptidoglycan-associated protein
MRAALRVWAGVLVLGLAVPTTAVGARPSTTGTTTPPPRQAQVAPTSSDLTAVPASTPVLDVNLPVLDLTLTIASADRSLSDEQTATQESVTLAADVLFAFDKADLTPAAQATITQAAQRIRDRAKGDVHVDGYTDSVGNSNYNVTLSEQRARAVVGALQPLLSGASVNLIPAGHGDANPVAGNTTADGSDSPEGRALNRRVSISFGATR